MSEKNVEIRVLVGSTIPIEAYGNYKIEMEQVVMVSEEEADTQRRRLYNTLFKDVKVAEKHIRESKGEGTKR